MAILNDRGPEFRLTADHLKLLRHLNITWNGDNLPWGGPGANTKRPFGNGDPAADIIKILGWPIPPAGDDELREAAEAVYAGLEHAMQIVLLFTGTAVQPGVWRRRSVYDSRTWEQIGD